ncbi:hypothetical protein Hanom_Chr14g01336571 [Helianthus anomalus]
MVNPDAKTYQICDGESTLKSPPPHLSRPHLNRCPHPTRLPPVSLGETTNRFPDAATRGVL